MSGYENTKPGGTAGVLLLSLQKLFVGDRSFLFAEKHGNALFFHRRIKKRRKPDR